MPSLKEAYKKRKYFGCLSSGRGFKDISKLFELSDCTVTMWGKILMIASLSRTDCPSKFIPQSLPNCPAQDLQATVVTVGVKVHLCTIRRIQHNFYSYEKRVTKKTIAVHKKRKTHKLISERVYRQVSFKIMCFGQRNLRQSRLAAVRIVLFGPDQRQLLRRRAPNVKYENVIDLGCFTALGNAKLLVTDSASEFCIKSQYTLKCYETICL